MEPLTASEAMIIVTTKQGVDEVFVGPDVLYFSRLTARATQSHLARIVALPFWCQFGPADGFPRYDRGRA